MTFLSDYQGGMMNRSQIDQLTAERLLTGDYPPDGEHADLASVLATMRQNDSLTRDPAQMATALAATARASKRTPVRRGLKRVAAVAMAGAMFFAAAGVALASDSAAPGDFLYGMDRALENLGIGGGGLEERVAELEALLGNGKSDEAILLLDTLIGDNGQAAVSAALHEAPGLSARASVLTDFIDDNKETGQSMQGSEFGQNVAEIAGSNKGEQPSSDSASTRGQSERDQANSIPDNGGARNDTDQGPPDNAGPQDTAAPGAPVPAETKHTDETGPPENSGSNSEKATKSEQAGPRDR